MPETGMTKAIDNETAAHNTRVLPMSPFNIPQPDLGIPRDTVPAHEHRLADKTN
jgi:hypothetical protein